MDNNDQQLSPTDKELQEALDDMSGHIAPAIADAEEQSYQWRQKAEKAGEELNGKSRRLISLIRRIFKKHIPEYCDIVFSDRAYEKDHSYCPPKISPHMTVSVRRGGYCIEKNFWPRSYRHIYQTAIKMRHMIEMVEKVDDSGLIRQKKEITDAK